MIKTFLFTLALSTTALAETHDCREDIAAVNSTLVTQGFENQGVYFQDALIVTAFEKEMGDNTVLMVFVWTSKQADATKAVENGYEKVQTTCKVKGVAYQPWVKVTNRKSTRT